MAKKQQSSDAIVIFAKAARVLTYFIYAYAITACVFLGIGFVMLLFGANPQAGFTNFIYSVASGFLEPFRGIFPLKPISGNAYFSPSALFAIIIYMISAMGLHALVSYITVKIVTREEELSEL